MVIKINYTSSDVYVSTSVSPVYVVVNYSGVSTGGGVWGQITGTLSNQTDLQNALDAKFDDPTGTTSQYLRGDGSLATFPSLTGYVPYTGATQDVDLGEFELKAGQVEFDQTPTGTAGVAVMRWNDSDGTVDLGLKGGNVTLQVGQEQVQRVVNKSGINLLEANYQVVRVSDAQGQRLAVQLAQGNNDANSTDTIGIVTETINDNQEGFVTTSGLVRNINTTGSLQGETWIDGDVLYLSPTVAGRITKVKPTAPNHSVILGYVVYAHANNGKIFVKVDNGYEIGELHDVYVPTPSNNDGIFWNTANSRYQNNSIAGVLGYTPISGSGATGQVAYWNGTNSQTGSNNLFWDAANGRLGIGTNTPAYRLHNVGTSAFDNGNSGDAVTILNQGFLRWTSVRFRGFSSSFDFQDNAYSTKVSLSMSGSTSIFNTGGNYSFGNNLDSGQRLQVYGDAFIKGSGNTSATNALLVQNSAGTQLLKIQNDGTGNIPYIFYVGQNSTNPFLFSFDGNSSSSANASGRNLAYYNTNTTQTGDQSHFALVGNALTPTSGDTRLLLIERSFAPTSGTAIFTAQRIISTINQTGGANGITRGLYVNPTLTAAADWRSIEWSNNTGFGLYGAGTAPNYLGGDLTVVGVFRETVTTNRQTASYSLVLLDRGKLVEMNVASANNLTVPLDSAIAFPVGTKIDISQYGAGQTTVVATSGVTVRSAGGALKLAVQYSGASLVKIATNEWYLFGDITV